MSERDSPKMQMRANEERAIRYSGSLLRELKKVFGMIRRHYECLSYCHLDSERERDGYETLLCPDFSDIYSYINPLGSDAHAARIVSIYLTSLPGRFVMLPGTTFELLSYIRGYINYFDGVLDSKAALRHILQSPEVAKFFRTVNGEMSKSPDQRDYAQIQVSYRKVSSKVPFIVSALSPEGSLEPASRLAELFERSTFAFLSELGGGAESIGPDPEVFKRSLKLLDDRRKGRFLNNKVDALNYSIAHYLTAHSNRKQYFALITRSNTPYDAFSHIAWDDDVLDDDFTLPIYNFSVVRSAEYGLYRTIVEAAFRERDSRDRALANAMEDTHKLYNRLRSIHGMQSLVQRSRTLLSSKDYEQSLGKCMQLAAQTVRPIIEAKDTTSMKVLDIATQQLDADTAYSRNRTLSSIDLLNALEVPRTSDMEGLLHISYKKLRDSFSSFIGVLETELRETAKMDGSALHNDWIKLAKKTRVGIERVQHLTSTIHQNGPIVFVNDVQEETLYLEKNKEFFSLYWPATTSLAEFLAVVADLHLQYKNIMEREKTRPRNFEKEFTSGIRLETVAGKRKFIKFEKNGSLRDRIVQLLGTGELSNLGLFSALRVCTEDFDAWIDLLGRPEVQQMCGVISHVAFNDPLYYAYDVTGKYYIRRSVFKKMATEHLEEYRPILL